MKSTVINKTEKLDDDLYVITEAGSVHCYIILGTKKAVLFDVGYGYEDIQPLIREFTDLPLVVVLSHGDPDHSLGAFHFEEVYIHELDYGKMLQNDNAEIKQSSLEYRYQKMPELRKEITVEEYCATNLKHVKAKFLRDKALIDLGDRHLEVIHIPGHSYGHIALLDPKKKRLFSGDMISSHNIWYFNETEDEQAPYDMAVASWKKIKNRQEEISQIYPAHGKIPITMEAVDDLLECFGGELQANYMYDQAFHSFSGDGWQHLYKSVNLIYSDIKLSAFMKVPIVREPVS